MVAAPNRLLCLLELLVIRHSVYPSKLTLAAHILPTHFEGNSTCMIIIDMPHNTCLVSSHTFPQLFQCREVAVTEELLELHQLDIRVPSIAARQTLACH